MRERETDRQIPIQIVVSRSVYEDQRGNLKLTSPHCEASKQNSVKAEKTISEMKSRKCF